jgi:hypothetical protein
MWFQWMGLNFGLFPPLPNCSVPRLALGRRELTCCRHIDNKHQCSCLTIKSLITIIHKAKLTVSGHSARHIFCFYATLNLKKIVTGSYPEPILYILKLHNVRSLLILSLITIRPRWYVRLIFSNKLYWCMFPSLNANTNFSVPHFCT